MVRARGQTPVAGRGPHDRYIDDFVMVRGVHSLRQQLADAVFHMPSDRITVRAPDIGGGADHNKVVVHDLGQPGEGQ